ncbi:PIG-L family deacetylase [Actinoplanes bogorensis]|uniref:PIG-L family deacetylase n=1 Tax=Paractinoplanes bogorensis TaxID=1610840 RepID=A0ABS5YXA5_9ACTN|nr:PIG-L family deacetylase [Actinoplanes bogorensis]MBU2668084.1 PIG-L family deacetylase [Actinoplanes bogorensis]
MTRPLTIVAVHAHPDDESLLTGGTLARAAAEGHRVVLVTATLGEAGGSGADRQAELHAAAVTLGCARVAELGYRDSGLHGDAETVPRRPFADAPAPDDAAAQRLLDAPASADAAAQRFADTPVEEAAARLAAILRAEEADVVIGYDSRGGYGHPDHVQVHHVVRRAAAMAGTRLLLEATIDRHRLRAVLGLLRAGGRLLPRLPLAGAAIAYTPREQITHTVDVRRYARVKRAALRAHVSQTRGPGIRTVALLARLPMPLFHLVAGREWFVEPSSARPTRGTDLFASAR